MEETLKLISSGFDACQKAINDQEKDFDTVEARLRSYISKAKQVLIAKHALKPKKIQKIVPESLLEVSEDNREENGDLNEPRPSLHSSSENLRPLRTAKAKANQNLKEIPLNAKMRNEADSVVIKTERTDSDRESRSSLKENKAPSSKPRVSRDEGIQSSTETLSTLSRSNSVEIVAQKFELIDITVDNDLDKMPPPPIPAKKGGKKTRTKKQPNQHQQNLVEDQSEDSQPQLRITRSKIKKEKMSTDSVISQPSTSQQIENEKPSEVVNDEASGKTASTADVPAPVKKKEKKKYPLPILIKMEVDSPIKKSNEVKEVQNSVEPVKEAINIPENLSEPSCNETFNVVTEPKTAATPVMNETITIATATSGSAFVDNKNPHDSLMTEDNDDEENTSMDIPLSSLKSKTSPLPALKLKKNEVFNPYMSSPVKQKVQAFEKHAVQSATPEKFKTLPGKYKSGTPSKVPIFSSKTTPFTLPKSKKIVTTPSGTFLPVASTSGLKQPKQQMKKMNSQESLEDKKAQQIQANNQLLEEKRKAREEKQRQAQLQREALEREKREQALRQQQEREEKYRRIMQEKEEKLRMEALKKKLQKERQAQKLAEERSKKEAVAEVVNKDDSLHLKLQKQILMEKSEEMRKAEAKKNYCFDMLDTDDSTDDESHKPSKRPPPPSWSRKSARQPTIVSQSYISPNILDTLFSVKPISPDLREIFPSINPMKLARNSSAVWRTPPKKY
ncbi:CLUMA_CG000210, isoform A [Clunio marinus]|uniref:CLUMA_CG000210, isoform A n=1 Tax=Clunio marinus TaxID=568069 RepID=A0A1J1HG14_9DIPT|nr:CLUMA_CG000210, isoform A [Clunio marinus]